MEPAPQVQKTLHAMKPRGEVSTYVLELLSCHKELNTKQIAQHMRRNQDNIGSTMFTMLKHGYLHRIRKGNGQGPSLWTLSHNKPQNAEPKVSSP